MAEVAKKDWQALAKVYHLHQVELSQLIDCTPVHLLHQWEMDEAAYSLREHHLARDHVQLVNVLCILGRAEMQSDLSPTALSVAALMLALEREESVSSGMAVAVRLARMLACKLERQYQFSKSFSK